MTSKEKREKFEQYRKEHLKRVPLDMQRHEYDRLKAHAVMAGVPVNRYIKDALAARMDKEDKKEGIDPAVRVRVNDEGKVEFYRRFDT